MNSKSIRSGEMIYNWLSQFTKTYRGVLPAGQEPDDLYLQFSGYYPNFAQQFILPVQIYKMNTTSYATVLRVADDIKNEVTEGGVLIGDSDIKIKIELGDPYYQDKPDEDNTVRAGYINLLVTIYG